MKHLDPYLSPPDFWPPDEVIAVYEHDAAVAGLANEILADEEMLDDAIGEFGSHFGLTGLALCLSNIGRCKTDEQFIRQGKQLQEHIQSIAGWYAERQIDNEEIRESNLPAFLRRQAD